MNKQEDTAGVAINGAGSFIEGGLFYPVGYIVAGLPEQQDASQIHQNLLAQGLQQDECALVSADAMVKAAEKDLDAGSVLAAFGSTGRVRGKLTRVCI